MVIISVSTSSSHIEGILFSIFFFTIYQIMSLIIIIDGVCVMCSVFARFVAFFNPEARFMWAQHEETRKFLTEKKMEENGLKSIIVFKEGKMYQKSDAFIQVLLTMNILLKIFAWLIFLIPKHARDWAYTKVADNRYKFMGKLETCKIPSSELKSKFLHS